MEHSTYIEYATDIWTFSTSESAAFASPSPNCTIGTSKCIDLWETYLEEHGLPTAIDNVTEPAITPVPTNRPRCSVGDVSLSCAPEKTRCIISANKVDLFYWPTPTAAPNASDASNITTAVFRNITMTSPSVYLIFDHLQALTSGVVMETCSFNSPLGATSVVTHLGPAASQKFIGGPYTNAVVSLDPTSLQSLVRDLGPGINTASVVSEIAHGGPDYYHWINNVLGSGINYAYYGGYGTNVTALPADFSDMKVPSAEAYYLNINGPFGCNRMGDHPQCSTIFDGAYRAQLLVPDQVRSLRPEWATCYDPLYGAYDPPIALTPAATIKRPGKGPDLQTKPPIALTPETTIVKPAPGPTGSSAPKETNSKDESPDPTTTSGAKPSDDGSSGSRPDEGNSNPPDSESPAVSDPSSPGSSNDKPSGSDENSFQGQANNPDSSSDSQPENQDPKGNGPSSTEPASNGQGDSSNDSQPKNQDPNANDSPSTDPASNSQGDSNAGDSNEAAHNVLDGLLGAAKETNTASNGESQSSTSDSASNAQGDDASSGENSELDNSSNSSKGGSSYGDVTSNDHSTPQSNGDSKNNGADGASSAGDSETGSSNSPSSSESAGSPASSENQNSGSSSDASPNDEDESQTNDQSPEQVIILNGAKHTVATPNGYTLIDGTTLAEDGSPTTINGQAMRAVDGGVVIGTQTVSFTADSTARPEQGPAAVFTADGHRITASPGSSGIAVIDGTTISVDGSAMTAHGATISAASSGIVVDGTTIPFEAEVTPDDGTVLTIGSDSLATASSVSSGVFAVGSRTLTVGGSDATISGHVVSAAYSEVVVDGSSISNGRGGSSSSTGTSDASSDAKPAEQTTSGAARSMQVGWAAVLGLNLLLMF